jgi:hypothetical protein
MDRKGVVAVGDLVAGELLGDERLGEVDLPLDPVRRRVLSDPGAVPRSAWNVL